MFNATAEITGPYAKYLLELESGAAWVNHARTRAQHNIADQFADQVQRDPGLLWSWVQWYDKATGHKESVTGFALYDTEGAEIALHLDDAERGLVEQWQLPARRCQGTAGRNCPAFLATNHALSQ